MDNIFLLSSIKIADVLFGLVALFLIAFYGYAVKKVNQTFKRWPPVRIGLWIAGVCSATAAVAGPVAHLAHHYFPAHMISHLLLGMMAPLFFVLAAPATLLFKVLPVKTARKITRLLKSNFVRTASEPVIAALLNVGSLWLLYTTNLYSLVQESSWLHFALYIHIFLAGYLFTASIIYIDPVAHRKSFHYRSVVLVIAFAAHSILAKYLYAYPPSTISIEEVRAGAVMMYYGGDIIDLALMIIFCFQWFKAKSTSLDTKTLFPEK